MSVIFVFVDGVGLGLMNQNNPFALGSYGSFDFMTRGEPFSNEISTTIESEHLFKNIDACLDVEGLPQSGTGQATLFSGKNASKILGRHFGPYPHSKIRFLLEENSVFNQLQRVGASCYFMNAFPEIFFERAKARNRWSCCTLMTKSAGIPINSVKEVRNGKAITAEIVQNAWREKLHINVPLITEEDAAQRVLDATEQHNFILVEYYLTDKAGHNQDFDYADLVLKRLDLFLQYLIKNKNDEVSIILTSDHGNLEDLSTKSHTFNDVPLFVYGPAAKNFIDVKSIQDITSPIVKTFKDYA